MEVPLGKDNKSIICIYEAIGTGLLLYCINMTAGSPYGKFGIAFAIFALILIGGPISGGHYNPAVTLGVFLSNRHWRKEWSFCLLIMLAQFIGGVWGCHLAWLSLYNSDCPNTAIFPACVVTRAQIPIKELVVLAPAPGVSDWDALQIEIVCSTVFVMMCLLNKTAKTKPTKQGLLGAFSVSTTLLAMLTLSGGRSGGCLNPAVGLSMTLF